MIEEQLNSYGEGMIERKSFRSRKTITLSQHAHNLKIVSAGIDEKMAEPPFKSKREGAINNQIGQLIKSTKLIYTANRSPSHIDIKKETTQRS